MSLILKVELPRRSHQNRRFLLTVYCTGCVKRVAALEKIVFIQNLLNPILPSL